MLLVSRSRFSTDSGSLLAGLARRMVVKLPPRQQQRGTRRERLGNRCEQVGGPRQRPAPQGPFEQASVASRIALAYGEFRAGRTDPSSICHIFPEEPRGVDLEECLCTGTYRPMRGPQFGISSREPSVSNHV